VRGKGYNHVALSITLGVIFLKRFKVRFERTIDFLDVEAENREDAIEEAWNTLIQDPEFDPYDFEVKAEEC